MIRRHFYKLEAIPKGNLYEDLLDFAFDECSAVLLVSGWPWQRVFVARVRKDKRGALINAANCTHLWEDAYATADLIMKNMLIS